MPPINDELVSQFMAFTGSSDASRAVSYLEMSGGNLETAVSLFMEHEQGGGAGGAGIEHEVRAPDATQTMRLMDDNVMHHPSFQLMQAMMEEQLAQTAFAPLVPADVRAAVNAAAHAKEDDDVDVQGAIESEDDEAGPARLSDMFAPPTHLIHRAGGFQGARAMAKDTKRWLLVNIQRDAEFSSHALNRDVWRDELVDNLIREGFIFWQQMDIHPEGRTYIERYQVADFPHVGIIDPRTGRLIWRKEGWTQENPLTAEFFAEFAMDFCSKNSFDRPPQAPRPTGAASSGAKRTAREMTEEEQLQAAMRASMEDIKANAAVCDVDDNDDGDDIDDDHSVEYIADSDDDSGEDDVKPAAEVEKLTSPHLELLALSIGEEPPNGPRIQFRMPDGKRVVRKFSGADCLKKVYAFVAQHNDDARNGKPFILMAGFPPSDLAYHDIDKETVDGCKLAGEAVTVRWKF